jgi:hypothetical protein
MLRTSRKQGRFSDEPAAGEWGLSVATPPKKGSRTPSGKPTIQCPECGEWVLLESGVGSPPHRTFRCSQGHRFGLAQAGNGSGAEKRPSDVPAAREAPTGDDTR